MRSRALQTTAAVALSVENGDAPIKNWAGVGSRDFPLAKKGMKVDGKVVEKYITKKLWCGDCHVPDRYPVLNRR